MDNYAKQKEFSFYLLAVHLAEGVLSVRSWRGLMSNSQEIGEALLSLASEHPLPVDPKRCFCGTLTGTACPGIPQPSGSTDPHEGWQDL